MGKDDFGNDGFAGDVLVKDNDGKRIWVNKTNLENSGENYAIDKRKDDIRKTAIRKGGDGTMDDHDHCENCGAEIPCGDVYCAGCIEIMNSDDCE